MKKILLFALPIMLFFASCSKDATINRQLNGDWNVTSIDGQAVPTGFTYMMTFDKTKGKEGDGKITVAYLGISEVTNFTYTLADEKITMNYPAAGTDPAYTDSYTVTDHSKKEMTFTEIPSTGSTGTPTVIKMTAK